MDRSTAEQLPFTPLLARGLAELQPEDLVEGSLMLELGMSVWLRRSGAAMEDALDAMLEVRATLVEAGGLDARTEPVPLLAGDARTALLGLAVYLDGLVGRAAAAAGVGRSALVEQALASLGA